VNLGEVYQGIDVKLKAHGNNVEKLFYVKPGAKPETINIKLSGAKEIRVAENGELEVETEQGTVRFSKPVAFQEDEGKKEFVETAYVLRGDEYGFNVGDYDRTRELVIDPILAATFLGGSNSESVDAIALDSTGNVYVTGQTDSSNFPGIVPGSADSTLGGHEGFVAKLNVDLSSILAATFLGGNDSDEARAIALDSTGNVYVAGDTTSADFPGVGPGSADRVSGAFGDGFIAKLDAHLSALEQELINDLVNLVVQSTSLDPNPVPGGPAGVFTITARLTNTSTENIREPINAIVKTLTNGNKLLSATEGDGGAGSKQAIDAGSDDALIPNESVTVQFRIALANRDRFSFLVDVSRMN
jgi:hypothetical protein